MNGDVRSQIEAAMADLRRLADIVAVAVARRDGLIIAHDLPVEVDPRKAAAMTAAIVGTSEMAARELGQGKFLQAIVDSELGKMLSTGAGDEALLVTLVRPEANMGLVLLGVERTARRIAGLLGGQ
ncbi:MAG TPA: roadblock/LC7 domain-containing protein [Thermoplasmata archaeon]|nr:roadblock/LC7 domain-containing protein [Thermoplasmata archaeon]